MAQFSPGELVRFLCLIPNLVLILTVHNSVAPSLVKNGLAVGVPSSDTFPEMISYASLSFSDPERYVTNPSPRYWLLWPGVFVMLVYSFADVVLGLGPIFSGAFYVNQLDPSSTMLTVYLK